MGEENYKDLLMKKYKIGGQFSGVGAFDQALNRLGIDYLNVYQAEWDKYARMTYLHNYEEPIYYVKDVHDTPSQEITEKYGSLDIAMFSPPCQAFSLAGKRLGKDDKRGILFFNSHEFIKVNKPRYFIFENVKGLLSDDNGKTFSEWVGMLGGKTINGLPVLFPHSDSVPYHLYWKVINAKDHGVPQNRERVFLIGIRDDKDNTFRFPVEEHLTKRLKDVLEDEVADKYFLSEKMIKTIVTPSNGDWKSGKMTFNTEIAKTINSRCAKMGRADTDNYIKVKSVTVQKDNVVIQLNESKESGGKQPYQQNRVYDINGINPALNAGQETWGGNLVNTYKIRRLTPRECFRLMDFPDTFTWPVSDSQAYKQAGNSIVVNVLYKILKNLNL